LSQEQELEGRKQHEVQRRKRECLRDEWLAQLGIRQCNVECGAWRPPQCTSIQCDQWHVLLALRVHLHSLPIIADPLS
jgi:hypothetical protein